MSNGYRSVTSADTASFRKILGENGVLTDEGTRNEYGHDETEDLHFPPEVVLKPDSPEAVSGILKYCNERGIPVTPIGARTGLSGGALSLYGGVGLSVEKLNRIIEIDEKNLQATVEPGVITQVFQEAVAEKGLFYPPDPSSRGSCFIGGNLAENSGGPRAVKYGVTADYILNLEVVLPDGSIINTGANVLKNATAYNLTQLMVGSEGTLGVITKARVKLIAHPKHELLMLVPFQSPEKACEAVSAVFREKLLPSALEFMERDAIEKSIEYLGYDPIGVSSDTEALLFIEVDGNDKDALYHDCENITAILEKYGGGAVLFADDAQQKERIWKVRKVAGEAAKMGTIYKEEDTVVPRYHLPQLLKGVKAIGKKYGFKSYNYGHAGDGNLHVNIIKGELSEEQWVTDVMQGIREIFELVVKLNGTLSGEHGIGHVQKNFMDVAFDKTQMELFKGIKRTFDPHGILNPGKIWEPETSPI